MINVPFEYGITNSQKLKIGMKITHKLIDKIHNDLVWWKIKGRTPTRPNHSSNKTVKMPKTPIFRTKTKTGTKKASTIEAWTLKVKLRAIGDMSEQDYILRVHLTCILCLT